MTVLSSLLSSPFEGREVAVALGPNDKMPMIGHEAIAANPHRPRHQRVLQDFLEGLVVGGLVKQTSSSDAPIKNVINPASGSIATLPRHHAKLTECAAARQLYGPVPWYVL